MTLVITHPYNCTITESGSGGGTGIVGPNEWNANHTLTGLVDVSQGGTAISSGTSGGVLYFSGSTTLASSGALTANALVVGGGAGAAPYTAAAATWDNTNNALTIASGTLTTSHPALTLTQTWNAVGVTFTGLLLNVTNTASAAASEVFSFQVGGTDLFVLQPNTNAILSLGDSTTATALRVYNTVDTLSGPTNYERGVFDWTTTSNVLTIGTQAGGTGTARNLQFVIGGSNKLDFGITNSNTWTTTGSISASAAVIAGTYVQAATLLVTSGTDYVGAFTGGSPRGFWIGTSAMLGFTTAAEVNGGTVDTGIARTVANVLEINTGTAGTLTGTYLHWGGQARIDAAFSKTNNTLANVTGSSNNLSVSVAAGRTYTFEAILHITAGASIGGVQAAIAGTCTATAILYAGWCKDTGTTGTHGYAQSSALAGAVANATTSSATTTIFIQGTITVANAGTLTVQFAQSSTNATASTVGRGSYFTVNDIA